MKLVNLRLHLYPSTARSIDVLLARWRWNQLNFLVASRPTGDASFDSFLGVHEPPAWCDTEMTR